MKTCDICGVAFLGNHIDTLITYEDVDETGATVYVVVDMCDPCRDLDEAALLRTLRARDGAADQPDLCAPQIARQIARR